MNQTWRRGSGSVWIALLGIGVSFSCMAADSQPAKVRIGQVVVQPTPADQSVVERFRLNADPFEYREESTPEVSRRLTITRVTFPSPIVTDIAVNNTVHCEFYCPKSDQKVPAVIVLHILGGDFPLARLFANMFAERGVAALFLKMPYYGERRDPSNPRRMISDNPRETVEGMTQAILDIRRATAMLASRPEIDAGQLGIFGISLGGITGALAATAEPRLNNVCLLLAGGDIGQVAWESRELEKIRRKWVERGGTKDEFLAVLREVDPVRYGERVRGRRILMLNAAQDELIPRSCTEALWTSFGEPPIVWYEGNHYSVIRHILNALHRSSSFFAEASAVPATSPDGK